MLCLQRSPSRAAYERRHSGHFETDHMIIADVRCCGLAYCIACGVGDVAPREVQDTGGIKRALRRVVSSPRCLPDVHLLLLRVLMYSTLFQGSRPLASRRKKCEALILSKMFRKKPVG